MHRCEDCQCGEVHECPKCWPEDVATELARSLGLPFIVVMLHKGHYLKYIASGEHVGTGGVELVLWHALLELDSQHY